MTAQHNRGYALVMVLWLLMLLSTMTASYHAAARAEAKLIAAHVHRAQAEALAEAGIWSVVHEHFASSGGADRAAHMTRDVALQEGVAAVVLADVAGRVNLNAAQPALLDSLLAYGGASSAERPALVAAIIEWRGSDASLRNGIEGIGPMTHLAKGALFATVDELRHVQGITDDLFRRIAPLLTVHGTHSRVQVEAAPAEVLLALPGADQHIVADVLRERLDLSPRGATRASGLDERFTQQRGSSGIYVVTSTAAVGSAVARISATVRYGRFERELVHVLAWESRGE